MVLGDFNCIISDLDTKSGNMATSNNLKLILENIIDTLWWIHLDGVFNLCQHFEISYSRYANKHYITGVYIAINDIYR
jgi:hypothetical protein